MKTFPTLYKNNKNSSIQSWEIFASEENGDAFYEVDFGQVDGARQQKRNYVEGKSIGRANETTPYQQAISEAESKWKKQLDKGYTLICGEEPESYLPMLAQEYHKKRAKVSFPCYVQPKSDGKRLIAVKNSNDVKLYSRNWKPQNLPHIAQAVAKLDIENIVLDGEAYIHGADFQDIISETSKKNTEGSTLIEYHIYDVIDPNKSFVDRYVTGTHSLKIDQHPLKRVQTVLCHSEEDIFDCNTEYLNQGYEGTMVRNTHAKYLIGHRSEHLLKLKEFMEEEFVIIGAEENKKMPGQCSILLVTKEGHLFKAKPEGETSHRENLWLTKDSLVGKIGTVKFFEWTTSENPVPRFPVFKCVRDYD